MIRTVAQLLGQSTIQMTLPCGSGPGVESGSVERLVAPRLKTATECRTSGAAFVGARHGGLGVRHSGKHSRVPEQEPVATQIRVPPCSKQSELICVLSCCAVPLPRLVYRRQSCKTGLNHLESSASHSIHGPWAARNAPHAHAVCLRHSRVGRDTVPGAFTSAASRSTLRPDPCAAFLA
jgi:hypothetical protein